MNKVLGVLLVLVCVVSIHALTVQRRHFALRHRHAPPPETHRLLGSPREEPKTEEAPQNIELNIHRANTNPKSKNLEVAKYGAAVGETIFRLLRLGYEVTFIHGFNGGEAWKKWIQGGAGFVWLNSQLIDAKADPVRGNNGRTLITAKGPNKDKGWPLSVLMAQVEKVKAGLQSVTDKFADLVSRSDELNEFLDSKPDLDAIETHKTRAQGAYEIMSLTESYIKKLLARFNESPEDQRERARQTLTTYVEQGRTEVEESWQNLDAQLRDFDTEIKKAKTFIAETREKCNLIPPLRRDLQSAQSALNKLKNEAEVIPRKKELADKDANKFHSDWHATLDSDKRVGFTDLVPWIQEHEKKKSTQLANEAAVPGFAEDKDKINAALNRADEFCKPESLEALQREVDRVESSAISRSQAEELLKSVTGLSQIAPPQHRDQLPRGLRMR